MSKVKVFLSHSNDVEDQHLVFDEIIPKLEKKGIEFLTQDEAKPGQLFLSRLTEIFKEADKSLLFITKKAIDRPWCNLELLMGLEDSQNKQQLSVILLLHNVEENEIPHLTVLQEAVKVNFQRGQDAWVSECVEKLRETKPMRHVMPAGNVAHGLVWSHYVGYLKQVLPVLEDQLKKSDWYCSLERNSNVSTKLYEMVPRSCTCIFDLSKDHESIELITTIEVKAQIKSGNFRKYDINMYSIKDDNQTYYFMCEYPSVIATMKTMEEHDLAKFYEGDKQLQLSRFYYTMNSVINHFDNCRDRARVLLFNDETDSVPSVLLRTIKADLCQAETHQEESQLDKFEGTSRSDYKYLVNVAHSNHEDDKQRANDIINHFEKNRILSSSILKHPEELPGAMENRHFFDAIRSCQWCIFLISKHSLKNEMLKLSVLSTLHDGINQRKVRVIPVIERQHGTNLCIPEALQWVTYVPLNDESKSHLDILFNIVSGEDLPLKTELFLTAGNIAVGLAWGYVANYLQIVLPEILDGVEKAMSEKQISKYKCPKKLFVIIPASCEADGLVKDKDDKIKNVTKTPDYFPTGRGTRAFNCQIYNIANSDLYFVGQYAAPVTCLKEMMSSRVAGVTDDAMESGAKNFYKTVENLTNSAAPDKSKFCEFVYFNDDVESLAEILKPKITASCATQNM